MSAAWQVRVCRSVMLDDATSPIPVRRSHVPLCSEECPHHDGKRCRIMGRRPGNLCEPVVEAMGAEIAGKP